MEIARPTCVVFPRTTADTCQRIVQLANQYQTPLIGRGAGTGLSGGALRPQRWHPHRFRAHESHPRYRHRKSARDRPARSRQFRYLSAAVAHCGCISTRPIPQARRACTIGGNVCRKFRGPAHARLRGHHESHRWASKPFCPTGELIRIGNHGTRSHRLRFDRSFCRLGRHACADHRNHRSADASSRDRQDAPGCFRNFGRRHRNRGRHHGARRSRLPRAKCSTAGRFAPVEDATFTPVSRSIAAAVLAARGRRSERSSRAARRRRLRTFAANTHAREVRVARDVARARPAVERPQERLRRRRARLPPRTTCRMA